MNNWKAYFAGWASMVGLGDTLKGRDVERLYQAIKARGEAEDKEKLTKRCGLCMCPLGKGTGVPGIACIHRGGHGEHGSDADLCTHPSNKAPEPECEHKDGLGSSFKNYVVYGKTPDKNFHHPRCPLCGDKLE